MISYMLTCPISRFASSTTGSSVTFSSSRLRARSCNLVFGLTETWLFVHDFPDGLSAQIHMAEQLGLRLPSPERLKRKEEAGHRGHSKFSALSKVHLFIVGLEKTRSRWM